jgi:hypothetical protein
VYLEDWPGEASVVCTAIDAAFVDEVEAVARSCRISWRNVRPRWAAALDDMLSARPHTALVAIAEEDAFTLLCGAGSNAPASRVEVAATYSPAPDEAQAVALWHRLMLSHDVPRDQAWLMHLPAPPVAEQDSAPSPSEDGGRWPRLAPLAEGAQP